MAIKEGDPIPDVKLTETTDGKPSLDTSAERARGSALSHL